MLEKISPSKYDVIDQNASSLFWNTFWLLRVHVLPNFNKVTASSFSLEVMTILSMTSSEIGNNPDKTNWSSLVDITW